MDFISSFSDRPLPPLADIFKNVTTISRPVKDHLVQVYATLAGMMILSAVGAYAEIKDLFLFRVRMRQILCGCIVGQCVEGLNEACLIYNRSGSSRHCCL